MIKMIYHIWEKKNYLNKKKSKNTRPVSAISPGVLGTTGIETAEILKDELVDLLGGVES